MDITSANKLWALFEMGSGWRRKWKEPWKAEGNGRYSIFRAYPHIAAACCCMLEKKSVFRRIQKEKRACWLSVFSLAYMD